MFIRLYGPGACWSIPQLRAEPHTYDVPTPSGIQGALESVYWKPEMQWVVQSIYVLEPIKLATMRINHVGKPASKSGLDVTAARAQRRITYLRDVDYVAHVRIQSKDCGKHLAVAERRLKRGQWYRRPYLGMAEFPAHLELCDGSLEPINDTRALGLMFWGYDWRRKSPTPRYFNAQMDCGVIDVPGIEETVELVA